MLLFGFAQCKNAEPNTAAAHHGSDFPTTKIDSICKDYIGKGNTVGFSVGVAHNGKVVFSKGYGLANLDSGKKATDSTIYAIASVSKFITALATMKLMEEGKLALSDKVVDYIPDFPKQRYMGEITIEHLLRHQSGLVDHEDWFDDIYINERRVFTDQEFYKFLDRPLFFRPGTQYSYSNSGFAILSRILEKIEGNSFNQLIEDNIAIPLGLVSLGLWPKKWQGPNASMGYEVKQQEVDTSFHMMTEGMKGDGGLGSSVLDLLKVMEGATKGTLITNASLEQMLSPTPVKNFYIDSGLGVKFGKINGQKTLGHSGGYKGTGWAILTHYPESGYTFAAAMNTNYSPEEIWTLRSLIMPHVLKMEPPAMETAPIPNVWKYTGEYRTIDRWGEKEPDLRIVSTRGDSLIWDNPATARVGAELFQMEHNTFRWKAYPYDEFKFHEVNGRIVACSQYLDGTFGGVWIKNEE